MRRKEGKTVNDEQQPDVSTWCGHCGTKLTRIAWNTMYDLLYCDNLNCDRYRQPQGSIKVDMRSMHEVIETYSISDKEARKWK